MLSVLWACGFVAGFVAAVLMSALMSGVGGRDEEEWEWDKGRWE